MLEALGVDTSKTFSLIETGEALERGDEPSPTRSSVLVRLSHSHIRIGSFQRLAYLREDASGMRRLLDYTIADLHAGRLARGRGGAGRRVPGAGLRRRRPHWARSGWRRASSTACSTPTTSTSPARASTTAPGASCRPTIPASPPPISTRPGLYAFGRQPEALLWNLARLGRVPAAAAPDRRSWRRRSPPTGRVAAGAAARPCCAASACVPAGEERDAGAGRRALQLPAGDPGAVRADLLRLARRVC